VCIVCSVYCRYSALFFFYPLIGCRRITCHSYGLFSAAGLNSTKYATLTTSKIKHIKHQTCMHARDMNKNNKEYNVSKRYE
jgi:hypothetical protein